jgi:hypothetical protein
MAGPKPAHLRITTHERVPQPSRFSSTSAPDALALDGAGLGAGFPSGKKRLPARQRCDTNLGRLTGTTHQWNFARF